MSPPLPAPHTLLLLLLLIQKFKHYNHKVELRAKLPKNLNLINYKKLSQETDRPKKIKLFTIFSIKNFN